MKPIARLFTAVACSTLVLTGCTAETEPGPGKSSTATVSGAAATTASPEAPTAEAPSPSPTVVDVEEAKAAAIAAGRPEPAWDKSCVAWKLPEADTEAQQWANDVTTTWLDVHGADCPDAIVWPHYYVETVRAGAPGELVVTIDDEALADYFVDPNSDKGLQQLGFWMMDSIRPAHPDLTALTVTVEDTDRSWTATPAQHDGGILTAP
jgi:hypothetical protein